jgi:ABC-type uncharacterized transport system fused permease/ATPase subunit
MQKMPRERVKSMSKGAIASAIIVAVIITAILVLPSLLTIWLTLTFGFNWRVAGTAILLILLMSTNYTLGLLEDES